MTSTCSARTKVFVWAEASADRGAERRRPRPVLRADGPSMHCDARTRGLETLDLSTAARACNTSRQRLTSVGSSDDAGPLKLRIVSQYSGRLRKSADFSNRNAAIANQCK